MKKTDLVKALVNKMLEKYGVDYNFVFNNPRINGIEWFRYYSFTPKEDEAFKELLPQDLLKFGLIPEFIGRLPIIATLKELNREALIKITTEPKNALVKQYKKLLEMDDVELIFEQEALEAIVDKAIERKTGARGLRSIMESIENIMRDIMFDIPSNEKIEQCIITKDTVLNNAGPKIIENPNKVKKTKSERIAVEQKETA